MKNIILLAISVLFSIEVKSQSTTLISNGSSWKYLDNGTNQGTIWTGGSFNDASWATGNAELGYGDGDEATVLSYGSSTSSKYITTYFRKTINVPTASSYIQFQMNLRRDDGVIVYINGSEVYRNNMPAGTVTFSTPASLACSDDGATILSQTLAANTLTNGTNVIAAEIHQNNGSSSDISFEFELLGLNLIPPASLVKGPYLQIGTPTSMVIRWETNVATDTKVAYGTSSVALTSFVTNAAVSTSHSVQITGLAPYTKYYYSIGTTTAVIQNGSNNFFRTSPLPNAEGAYRFWITGDCGNASTNQTNCKNQYLSFTGTTETNGWLLLGDNAYSSGTQTEYNTKFFAYYQNDIMKNAVLWPTPGNHDYYSGSTNNFSAAYFSIFSTPQSGQAGGVASSTPAYYSYDYGNIHFISLDSYGNQDSNKMYDTTGAQAVWLKADLAATNKRWKVAYWHHPPYTMGSHNSDTESDLVAIHTRFIRILERSGVDLIMCGHSHDYERSKLMNGHYGNEASFNAATHNLSTQSGKYDATANSCAYVKDSTAKKKGTVYVVSGSAGQVGGTQGSFPHNAMHYSNASNGGSMVLDINANRLDAKWICADGQIRDRFTMFKDVNVVHVFTVTATQTTNIAASWPGSYVWSNSAATRSISVTTSVNTTFWVRDPNNCIADTFKFVVNGLPPNSNFGYTGPYCAATPVSFNDNSINTPTSWSWSVSPSSGVTINTSSSQNPNITFNNAGTYTITMQASNSFGSGVPISKTLTINANPTITVNVATICSGNSATLSAIGATSYSWNTGATSSSITVNPLVTTIYSVTGTSTSCSANQTSTVTVNTTPTVSVNSATICNGANAILTANGASTYSWNTGATSNSILVSPIVTTTYSIIGTSGNCTDLKITTVNVNPNPIVVTTSSGTLICAGQTVTLTANGAQTYSWSSGGLGNNIAVSPTVSTTYTVIGTDVNNCSALSVFTQSVSNCTGLNLFSYIQNIILFPNPNNGSFDIKLDISGEFEIEIYNLIGSMVYIGKLNSGSNKINLKSQPGIYYYKITDYAATVQEGKILIEK